MEKKEKATKKAPTKQAQKEEQKEDKCKNLEPWKQFKEPASTFDLSEYKKTDLLPKEFYHQDVVTLSKELLGKVIVRETPEGIMKAKIVETEAYKAPLDKACHAYNNKKTDRTKAFWLEGGHCYMYSIYGANYCLNVVAYKEDWPEAVLVRAVEPIEGRDIMNKYRGPLKSKRPKDFSGGPAKYTKAMDIDVKRFNMIDLRNKKSKLWIEKGSDSKIDIVSGPRININYAQEWVNAPWRFYIRGNEYVSV